MSSRYHLVFIVELQHHVRRTVSDLLRIPVNLHTVENQSLVPGWVQRCFEFLCRLTDVQERHVCVGICGWR